MLKFLIDLLFPKICFGCGRNGSYLCSKCFKEQVRVNLQQRCHVCGKECRVGMVHQECSELSYLDGLIYVATYDGIIKKLLFDAKYNLYFAILNDVAKIMAEYLKFYNLSSDFEVTAVPLHRVKKRKRGFNQSEVLARGISRHLGKCYRELLIKAVATKSQMGQGRQGRLENLTGSFVLNQKAIYSNTNILIVDDVYTTGTTLNECAKVLKSAGFQQIIGFTFARSRG